MTPVQQKKLQKIISAWIKARQKSLGVTSGQLPELGWQASEYGSFIPQWEAACAIQCNPTLAYEDDCTVEETQKLFAAYADIRGEGKN